jgi:hypothetical protein
MSVVIVVPLYLLPLYLEPLAVKRRPSSASGPIEAFPSVPRPNGQCINDNALDKKKIPL